MPNTEIVQTTSKHVLLWGQNLTLKRNMKLLTRVTKQLCMNVYIIFTVGQGAYGIVVAARDKTSEDEETALIAIKKIEKAFEHRIFTKRTLRELKILRLLNHENVSLTLKLQWDLLIPKR